MTKVEFYAGCTIDSAFKQLHTEAVSCGDVTYGEFNGKRVTSQMTLDECYLAIVGKTKKEFDEEQKKWLKDYEEKEKAYKDSIPSLIPVYMEKAKGRIREKDMEYFATILPVRLEDLYHGMEIDSMFELIDAINKGVESFEGPSLNDEAIHKIMLPIKEIFLNQGHSGMSASLVAALMVKFAPFGKEFNEYCYKM